MILVWNFMWFNKIIYIFVLRFLYLNYTNCKYKMYTRISSVIRDKNKIANTINRNRFDTTPIHYNVWRNINTKDVSTIVLNKTWKQSFARSFFLRYTREFVTLFTTFIRELRSESVKLWTHIYGIIDLRSRFSRNHNATDCSVRIHPT